MPRIVVAGVVALLLAGCAPEDASSGAGTTTAGPATTITTTTTAAVDTPGTATPPPSDGTPAPCLADDAPFQQEGNAGLSPSQATDARALAALTWEVHEGCERIELALATAEGAPAVEPPTVSSFFLRDAGVLRVSLGPEVGRAAVSEHLVDTGLVDRVFVVRSLDGSLFADLHLAAPAFARVSARSSPAAAVIDLRPGGPTYPRPPSRQGDLVLVEPAVDRVAYPFTATGYLRTGEDTIEGTLRGPEGSVTVTGSAGEQADSWGAFVLLFPNGPEGPVELEVAGTLSRRLEAG